MEGLFPCGAVSALLLPYHTCFYYATRRLFCIPLPHASHHTPVFLPTPPHTLTTAPHCCYLPSPDVIFAVTFLDIDLPGFVSYTAHTGSRGCTLHLRPFSVRYTPPQFLRVVPNYPTDGTFPPRTPTYSGFGSLQRTSCSPGVYHRRATIPTPLYVAFCG